MNLKGSENLELNLMLLCEYEEADKEVALIAMCDICHEKVMDGRYMIKDGKLLCKSCADGAYYKM